jgi:hypothetical protein
LSDTKGKNHSISSAAKIVNSEDKSKFINYLKGLLWNTNNKKTEILRILKDVNSEGYLIISNLNKICKKVKEIIKMIEIEGRATIPLNKISFQNKGLTGKDIKEFEQVINTYQKTKYKNFQFDQGQCFLINSKSMLDESFDKYLYLCKDHSSNILSLNLDTFSSNIIASSNGLRNPGFVQISKNELFIHGGWDISGNYYSTPTILNINTLEYSYLNKGIEVAQARPLYHSEKVYLFGGYKNFKLISGQMLDLRFNSWKTLSNLPNPINFTVSVYINDKILIAGCENTLLLYDVFMNTYETAASNIEVSFRNILGVFQGTTYLISNKIYQQKDKKCKNWKIVNEKGLNGENIATSAVVWKGMIFFADWQGNVYKFDCLEKTLNIVSVLAG